MRILPAGEAALLVEVADLDAAMALHRGILRRCADGGFPGVVQVVPGARTVLVDVDLSRTSLGTVADALADVPLDLPPPPAESGVVVEVVYDGADLAETSALLGLDRDGFVAWHTGVTWTVGFTGFAPGFAYLVSDAHRTPVPRLESPRASVPAGSVGLADTFTGVYPRPSPGGWRLVGRTAHVLFDPDADPPAALRPGDAVRFVEAR